MAHVPVDVKSSSHLTNLIEISRWNLSKDSKKLSKSFLFKDFKAAFAFMTQISLEAEKHNHHPEWFNVYNRVDITWSTHDIDGLSDLDLNMANYCDSVYSIHSI